MARTRNQKNIEIPSPQIVKDTTVRTILQAMKNAIELGSAKLGELGASYVTKQELKNIGLLEWDAQETLYNPNALTAQPFKPSVPATWATMIFEDGSFVINEAESNLVVKI